MDKNSKKNAIISQMLNENNERWHLHEKNIIYMALKERFGAEVDEIIKEAVGSRSQKIWQKISQIAEENSLDEMLRLIFDPLPEMGWEFIKSEDRGKISYRVTKCPKFDIAKELGAEELMFLIACATDEYMAKGFNKDIKFTRTKTLMEGHECCNHTYFMKKTENSDD